MSEPFFATSLAHLRAEWPPPLEVETGTVALERVCDAGGTAPSGVIVHMTRCGSTLVLNALREANEVVALGEAQPMDALMGLAALDSRHWSDLGRSLLTPLATVFSRYQGRGPKKLIVKCGIEGAMALPILRAVWPDVPCIVLIRNPIEIIVSNLEMLPRWASAFRAGKAPKPFSNPPEAAMSHPSAYLAWALGRFHAAALGGLDRHCAIVDYEDISPATIQRIATFFGIDFGAVGERRLAELFAVNAKSPRRRFAADSEAKRDRATDALRLQADKWVNDLYRQMKDHACRLLGATAPDTRTDSPHDREGPL